MAGRARSPDREIEASLSLVRRSGVLVFARGDGVRSSEAVVFPVPTLRGFPGVAALSIAWLVRTRNHSFG